MYTMILQLPTESSHFTPSIIADQLNNFKLNPEKDDVQPEILQTYILQRILWYTVNNWVGGQLQEYYQYDFKNWDKAMMDKYQNSVINLLPDFLVKHGLYIQETEKYKIPSNC